MGEFGLESTWFRLDSAETESGKTGLEVGQLRRERWKQSQLIKFINIGGFMGLLLSGDIMMAGRVRLDVRLLRSVGAINIGTLVGAGAFAAWTGQRADDRWQGQGF